MPKAEPRGLFVAKPWRFTQEMQVPGVPAQVRGLSAESHMEDANTAAKTCAIVKT